MLYAAPSFLARFITIFFILRYPHPHNAFLRVLIRPVCFRRYVTKWTCPRGTQCDNWGFITVYKGADLCFFKTPWIVYKWAVEELDTQQNNSLNSSGNPSRLVVASHKHLCETALRAVPVGIAYWAVWSCWCSRSPIDHANHRTVCYRQLCIVRCSPA